MNYKKIAATVLILLICWSGVWVGKIFLQRELSGKVEEKYRARSKGNPKADYWIIEYMDFQCKSCQLGFKTTAALLESKPKEVFLQGRHYPLIHNHLYALKSSIYAECAAKQGRYWEMAEQLFETQERWAVSKDPDSIFTSLAEKIGINTRRLTACVEDPSTKEAILAEKAEGKGLGIKMTPTFFVNGHKIEGVEALVLEVQNHFSKKEDGAVS